MAIFLRVAIFTLFTLITLFVRFTLCTLSTLLTLFVRFIQFLSSLTLFFTVTLLPLFVIFTILTLSALLILFSAVTLRYVRDARLLAEPALTTRWLGRTALLGRLLDLPIAKATGDFPLSVFADFAVPLDTTQAPALLHGLQHKRDLLRYTALTLVCRFLTRLRNALGVLRPSHRARLVENARRRLPGLEVLLAARHACFRGVGTTNDVDGGGGGGGAGAGVGAGSTSAEAAPSRPLAQAAVVHALALYSMTFPGAFAAAKIDVAKLMPAGDAMHALPQQVTSVYTSHRPPAHLLS
jgi:hypothetical protein